MIETKFKQTELAFIPEDWDVGTFADFLTTFSAGATPYRGIPDNFIGQIPWISSGELNYCEIDDTREHISLDAQKKTHLTVHKPGTFLIAITGLEAEGTRGRCAFVKTPATTNQSCLAINSTDRMTVKYLFWFYRQWSDYLAFNFSQGSKQQSFTAEIAKRLPIYAPLLKEQEKIAEALNDVDALIRELDNLSEKKKAVLQGTMQELLTGRRRLPGFSSPWLDTALGKYSAPTMGQSPSSSHYNNSGNGLPLIQGNADMHKRRSVIRNYSSEYTKTCVKGDIIMSVRAPVGVVGLASFDSCIGRGVCSFKKDLFLYYLLMFYEDRWQSISAGSTFESVSGSQIKNFMIYIPSEDFEREAIAEILSDMDLEIAELEAKREKYAAIRQGMMQQLLTGKIRLI